MTVIVWDGKTLAADRRACASGHIYTIAKIARVGDRLVGVSGAGDRIRDFQLWIAGGADPAKYPPRGSDDDYWIGLVIEPNGVIHRYESSPNPITVEETVHALGTGRDFARAALHYGKTAREAVELACIFVEDCGNGIDVLALNE